MPIVDSGARQEFETGAVRDIQKQKGRCDLLPLDVVADLGGSETPPDNVLMSLHRFTQNGRMYDLYFALDFFCDERNWNIPSMILEVSVHFEEGAEKYGENNWQKGLPVKSYINSAVRHYMKWLRGDDDEMHDRAFCWNILCAIWTCKHKPELNNYGFIPCSVCGAIISKDEKECPHCRVHVGMPVNDADDLMGEYEEENE